MLRQYIKAVFINQNQKDDSELELAAIQYIYLLTLYNNESMINLSYTLIQDLLQSFNDCVNILGLNSSITGRQVSHN